MKWKKAKNPLQVKGSSALDVKAKVSKTHAEESKSEEGEMSGDRETKGAGEKCSPILFSSCESEDITIPLSGFVTEKSNHLHLKYLSISNNSKMNAIIEHLKIIADIHKNAPKKDKVRKMSDDPLATTSEYSSTETDVDCPRVNTHGEVKTQRWNQPKPTEIPLEKFQKAPTRHSQRISNMEKSKNKQVRYTCVLKSSI